MFKSKAYFSQKFRKFRCMKSTISALQFSLFLFGLLILLLSLSPEEQKPIRALLITGGGWHDYETQEKLLTEGISRRLEGEIEWTIIHEGDKEPDHLVSLMQEENWTVGYDVIVHNTGFGRVTDADYVQHFVEHHKGTPAVLIHASMHSYRYAEPADPWFEFIGLQSMRHESQRPLKVENQAWKHPSYGRVSRGMDGSH